MRSKRESGAASLPPHLNTDSNCDGILNLRQNLFYLSNRFMKEVDILARQVSG